MMGTFTVGGRRRVAGLTDLDYDGFIPAFTPDQYETWIPVVITRSVVPKLAGGLLSYRTA